MLKISHCNAFYFLRYAKKFTNLQTSRVNNSRTLRLNSLSANPEKWSNTLKQFVSSAWTVRFCWQVNLGVSYQPGIVGTLPSVIPPVVCDGQCEPSSSWLTRSFNPGIIRYSFTDLGRMENWVARDLLIWPSRGIKPGSLLW